MSIVNSAVDSIQSRLSGAKNWIQSKLFGTNNETLDYLMDSFYKLNPNQRNGVLAGIVGVIGVVVVGLFGLYMMQVNSLEKDLSNSFKALAQLETFKKEIKVENTKFDNLVKFVKRKSGGVKLLPYLESLSKKQGVDFRVNVEEKQEFPEDNPLSEQLEMNLVKFDLTKISVPKLVKFLVDIEKSGLVRVQDLEIRERHGTKMFFDGRVTVRGPAMKR